MLRIQTSKRHLDLCFKCELIQITIMHEVSNKSLGGISTAHYDRAVDCSLMLQMAVCNFWQGFNQEKKLLRKLVKAASLIS